MADRRSELSKPFRPHVARIVAACGAAGFLLAGPLVGFLLPQNSFLDGIGFTAFFWGLAFIVTRFGMVSATPTDGGLTVRNVWSSRTLEWAEIIAVRAGHDLAWAKLDLSDGTTLPVMAIQQADGERYTQEASRLAAWVEAKSAAQ